MLHGLILSILSALCYSTLPILAKLAYESGLERGEMLAARFSTSVLIMLVYLLAKDPKLLRIRLPTLLRAAAIGIGLFSFQTTLFFSALESIPASTATLILYFYPLTVTLCTILFSKTRLERGLAISLALVTAGCCSVALDTASRQLSMRGVMLAVASLLAYTLYLLAIQKVVRRTHPLTMTFYILVFVAATFCVTGRPSQIPSFTGLQFSLSFALGLIPTVLAISLLFLAIEKIGASYASIFSTFEPVATLIGAYLVLGEEIGGLQVVGLALIIGGIVAPSLKLRSPIWNRKQTATC